MSNPADKPIVVPKVIEVVPDDLLALTVEEAGRVHYMLQHLVPDEWIRDDDWQVVSRIAHWCREHPDL